MVLQAVVDRHSLIVAMLRMWQYATWQTRRICATIVNQNQCHGYTISAWRSKHRHDCTTVSSGVRCHVCQFRAVCLEAEGDRPYRSRHWNRTTGLLVPFITISKMSLPVASSKSQRGSTTRQSLSSANTDCWRCVLIVVRYTRISVVLSVKCVTKQSANAQDYHHFSETKVYWSGPPGRLWCGTSLCYYGLMI